LPTVSDHFVTSVSAVVDKLDRIRADNLRDLVLANETVETDQDDCFVLEVVPPGRELVIRLMDDCLQLTTFDRCEEVERMLHHRVEHVGECVFLVKEGAAVQASLPRYRSQVDDESSIVGW